MLEQEKKYTNSPRKMDYLTSLQTKNITMYQEKNVAKTADCGGRNVRNIESSRYYLETVYSTKNNVLAIGHLL
jgi:hypothetical protein